MTWYSVQRGEAGWCDRREIDLERTARIFLLPQETEKGRIVLSAASDKLHCIIIGRPILHILATIEETFAKVGRYEEVERLEGHLVGVGNLGGSDIEECSLMRRTGESAEELAEIISASRARGYKHLHAFKVLLKDLQLVGSAANRTFSKVGTTNILKQFPGPCRWLFKSKLTWPSLSNRYQAIPLPVAHRTDRVDAGQTYLPSWAHNCPS